MDAFLDAIAGRLLEQHGTALQRVTVVLPGRRAGLHLRKYLAARAGTTLWSPRLHDMGGFLQLTAGMRQGGSMELLFMLYATHRQLAGDRADTLEEFLQWGPTTLRDMSEIDAHALDLDTVYRDLRSYHEIEEWSFRLEGEPSAGQARLEQHWKHTGALHRAFIERMEAQRVATSGHVARRAMDAVRQGILPEGCEAVWFVGLNALEPAATAVVHGLQQAGVAQVAWDADVHYLEAPIQEAGAYLRRSIRDLGPGVFPPVDLIRTRQRTVREVQVPNTLAQATCAGVLIAELTPEERARTAVVLADEQVLLPLLAAMPADVGPMNVTMGLPLEALPIHGCVEALLDLHTGHQALGSFRYDQVERLLLHPLLHHAERTPQVLAGLRATKRTRHGADALIDLLAGASLGPDSAVRDALRPVDHAQRDLPGRIAALLSWANALVGTDAHRREQLFQTARLQRRFDTGLARAGAEVQGIESYRTLRQRMLREERIAFFGEPLQGLQVMGFLETRAIDHDRVIVVGASEGTLPPGGLLQSWIPHEVRRVHGLPMRSDADAISAYHFARMAQRTSHLTLVYGGGDAMGSATPSRFALQWRHELGGGRSNTVFAQQVLTAPFPTRPSPVVSVAKDAATMERLARICEKGLSPSALAAWLRCPLDFHFTRVLRIQEADAVDDRLASDVLGDAVHGVLEDAMRPFLHTPLDPESLTAAAGAVHQQLLARLAADFEPAVLDRGHFKLRIDMAATAMARHLQAEAERCRQEVSVPLGLEMELAAPLRPGVTIRGRADRVERRDGVVHILDLKTGATNGSKLKLPDLDPACLSAEQAHALQLVVYAWTYLQANPEEERVRARIVPIQRSTQAAGIPLKVGGREDITRDMLPSISALLNALVDDILNANTPMQHRPESLYCTACLNVG